MVQKAGGVGLLDDTEGAYNDERAANIGVDVGALAYTRSYTVDDFLKATKAFLKVFRESQPGPVGLFSQPRTGRTMSAAAIGVPL